MGDCHGNLPLHVAFRSQSLSSCDGTLYNCNKCRKALRNQWYQHVDHNYGLHGQFCTDCVSGGIEPCYFDKERYVVTHPVRKIKETIKSIITLHPLSASIPD